MASVELAIPKVPEIIAVLIDHLEMFYITNLYDEGGLPKHTMKNEYKEKYPFKWTA